MNVNNDEKYMMKIMNQPKLRSYTRRTHDTRQTSGIITKRLDTTYSFRTLIVKKNNINNLNFHCRDRHNAIVVKEKDHIDNLNFHSSVCLAPNKSKI
jgi:hypothetical protein